MPTRIFELIETIEQSVELLSNVNENHESN